MTAPPAEGVRVNWESVPVPVRVGVEAICGSPVVRATSQPGGFSPGVAARLECADGARWFVKAVSAEANPGSPGLHRREAEVLRGLDPVIAAAALPVPRLHGFFEAEPWVALVLEDVDGRQPTVPWERSELARVLAAVDDLCEALTPSPMDVATLAEQFSDDFTGWQKLRDDGDPRLLDSWTREHLTALADLELRWPDLLAGDTLLHADLRADNILLTGDQVKVVDWPHACAGAAFVDVVFMAPSVTMQGGPPPGDVLAMTRSGRAASQEAVAAAVCGMAGYFTEAALRPPVPGIPTVRAFQAAQGEIARRWLADVF
ncbi:MAG: aminoglycoside phosphotransferase family protein [Nocardiopsaceae bacterium]|jgi:aminoglycoside phosphotransferase (APT) family kinase protein|nr:aminoglycoside phosphotransferase family protein [Nocardiopsaceae bacterium]